MNNDDSVKFDQFVNMTERIFMVQLVDNRPVPPKDVPKVVTCPTHFLRCWWEVGTTWPVYIWCPIIMIGGATTATNSYPTPHHNTRLISSSYSVNV